MTAPTPGKPDPRELLDAAEFYGAVSALRRRFNPTVDRLIKLYSEQVFLGDPCLLTFYHAVHVLDVVLDLAYDAAQIVGKRSMIGERA